MNVEHMPGLEHLVRLGARIRSLGPRLGGPFVRRPQCVATEVSPPAPGVVSRLSAASRWAGLLTLAVGYHGLLGWLFDIPALRTPGGGIPPIRLHEALGAILAGGALFVVQLPDNTLRDARRPILGASGAMVGVTALVGLIAQLTDDPLAPAAMTVAAALAFAAIAAGLLVLALLRDHAAAEVFGLVSGAISLDSVAGYAYGAAPAPGQLPLYTAIATLLVSVSLVLVRADRGFMAKVASDSLGGSMARRLLPATLIVPFVFGWLLLRGLDAGAYTLEPGLALFTLGIAAVFVAVVWWSVNSLYRMDTQRRHAERALEDTAARLGRSNADLEQFAYVTSHDLKEPLRAISGSVQLLEHRLGEQIGPDAAEFIHHVVDGSNRMQTLIDDLLTYSRLTTREAPLEPTDCEAIFAEVLDNLQVTIRENGAVVTHDRLPTVRADRTQLLQVFQNLIANGIKYRSERTPRVHTSAEDRGEEWLFSVRDNGIGIAPQYADRIFKIFQRLHTRKDYPGTGIGLAVCKKVVERHGGHIWVESEPEEGSTFYFTLPKHPRP